MCLAVLPIILSFLDKIEDYIAASQVSRSWRAATHAAKPRGLVIDTCFGSPWDPDAVKRVKKMLRWFKTKVDRGQMVDARSMTLALGRLGDYYMVAWCLMLVDLKISYLRIDVEVFSKHYDWLPSTITHLVLTGCEANGKLCASQFRQLTRLTSVKNLGPILLSYPENTDLSVFMPQIRHVKLRIPASLQGQAMGDRILGLPNLTEAHFDLFAANTHQGHTHGVLKFHCAQPIKFTTHHTLGDLQVRLHVSSTEIRV